jgi:hypothetical protein
MTDPIDADDPIEETDDELEDEGGDAVPSEDEFEEEENGA